MLEVLLAVTIFAVVSSMVGYAVRTAVTTLEATGNRKDIIRQARIALERIQGDLAAVQGGTAFVGESRELAGSPADSLRFYSAAHLDFSSSQRARKVAEIRYEVEMSGDEQSTRKLIRYDIPALPGVEGTVDEGIGYVLCEQLAAVSFSFVDGEGQKTDTWDSKPVEEDGAEVIPLPATVYVSLEFLLDESERSTLQFDTAFRIPDVAGSSEVHE